MNISRKDYAKYLYDFVLWDSINRYNHIQKSENENDLITMSKAFQIRNNIKYILNLENGMTIDSITPVQYMRAINEAFSKSGIAYETYDLDSKEYEGWKKQYNDFNRITGTKISKLENGENQYIVEKGLLITPFNQDFENYDKFIKGEPKLRYLDSSNYLNYSDFEAELKNYNDLLNIEVYTHESENGYTQDGRLFFDYKILNDSRNKSKLVNKSDLVYLNKLLTYNTAKNNDGLAQHINIAIDDTIKSGEFDVSKIDTLKSKTSDMIDMLDYLNATGKTFSIEKGYKPGILLAKVDNSNVKITLMDVYNPSNVGSITDSSFRYSFSSTMSKMSTYYDEKTAWKPTTEDNINLLKYALGEPVSKDGKSVGVPGYVDRMNKNKPVKQHSVYYEKDTNGSVKDKMIIDYTSYGDRFNNRVRIKKDYIGGLSKVNFADVKLPNKAEAFLKESIRTSKEKMMSTLNIDKMIEHFEEFGNLDDFQLSRYNLVANIQKEYISYLEGNKDSIFKPGYEKLEQDIINGDVRTDSELEKHSYEAAIQKYKYDVENMTKSEIIKQNSQEMVDYLIGQYELNTDTNLRFDPVLVSTFMDGSTSTMVNNRDIEESLRTLGINPDELMGDAYYNTMIKDNLIKFDYSTAKPIDSLDQNPFWKKVADTVKESLARSGVSYDPRSILVDDNGIISYKGSSQVGHQTDESSNSSAVDIQGFIGQIFEPQENGVIKTKFGSGNNYSYVPGYKATIVKANNKFDTKQSGENNVFDRTRLKGYEQIMLENIKSTISVDVSTAVIKGVAINSGSTTNLNKVYRQLYGSRHDINFEQDYLDAGMDKELLDAIIKSETQKIRYENTILEGSTIHADFSAKLDGNVKLNDISMNAYDLTGHENMAILSENADKYFDPIATTATSTNQGSLRYLKESATVNPDGTINPAKEGDRTSIFKHDVTKYFEYNPFDRQNMTLSNVMTASSVTEPVGVAQMTFGGWNYDDAFVVSKDFAIKHKMLNTHPSENAPKFRELIVGDKLSDLNGNKGVISLIVDRDMSDEEAEAKGILEEVKWFRANPDMDVVTAPFSAISRFNGGTFRELETDYKNLFDPNGKELTGGTLGKMRLVVTDKGVDSKTNFYTKEDNFAGKGRKVSSQLAWAINAKGANNILKEAFKYNDKSFVDLKEYLATCGIALSDTGMIIKDISLEDLNYENPSKKLDVNEERNEIDLIGRINEMLDNNMQPQTIKKTLRSYLDSDILDNGGFMRIPFELKYITGEPLKQDESGTYELTIMSKTLRSDHEMNGGGVTTHDYTQSYMGIIDSVVDVVHAKRELEQVAEHEETISRDISEIDVDNNKKKRFETKLEKAKMTAQNNLDTIMKDINNRVLSGKHNIFKEKIMSNKMADSFTAVWTPDPTVKINELKVGRAMAESIGLKDGEKTLIWRDPILRDSGVKYMKVSISDDITGLAVNPVIDKPFEGDYDGDSIGGWKPVTKAAIRDAEREFSWNATFLDLGSKDENGLYNLAIGTELDVKVAEYYNDDIRKELEEIKRIANEQYKENKWVSDEIIDRTSNVIMQSYKEATGKAVIKYEKDQHLQSVYDSCIKTRAKGSVSKLKDYSKWVGLDAEINEITNTVTHKEDFGETGATREMQKGTAYATAVKSFGTGVAGMFSQKAIAAFRNLDAKAILELTHPVTQVILQSKHDPVQAAKNYKEVMTTAKEIWSGKIFKNVNGSWKESGNPSIAGSNYKEEWKKSFIDYYTSKDGFGLKINEDYVEALANAMEATGYKGIFSKELEKSPLDELAYGGNVNTFKNLAGKNLFAGEHNMAFMPSKIQKNQERLFEAYIHNYEAENITELITKVDYLNTSKKDVKYRVPDIQIKRKDTEQTTSFEM